MFQTIVAINLEVLCEMIEIAWKKVFNFKIN